MPNLNTDPVLGVEKDDPNFEPTSLESLFDRPAFPERDPATGRFKKVEGDDDAGDPPAASETQPPAGEAQGDDAGETGAAATDDGAKAAAGQKPSKESPAAAAASQPATGEVKDKPGVPLAAKMAASKRAQDAESELKRLREENAALKARPPAAQDASPTQASSPRQAEPAQRQAQPQARQRRDVFEDTEGFAQDIEAAAAERAENRMFNKALAMSERQARREFGDFEEIMGTELVTDPATGQQNPMQRNWLAYLNSLPPAQAEAKRREFYDHPEPVFFAYEETKAWLETRNGEQAGGAQDEEALYAKFAARFRKEMGLDEAPAAGGSAAPAVQPKPASAVKPAAATPAQNPPAADPPAAPPASIASRRATGPARGEPSFAGPTPLDAIFERVGKQNRR